MYQDFFLRTNIVKKKRKLEILPINAPIVLRINIDFTQFSQENFAFHAPSRETL